MGFLCFCVHHWFPLFSLPQFPKCGYVQNKQCYLATFQELILAQVGAPSRCIGGDRPLEPLLGWSFPRVLLVPFCLLQASSRGWHFGHVFFIISGRTLVCLLVSGTSLCRGGHCLASSEGEVLPSGHLTHLAQMVWWPACLVCCCKLSCFCQQSSCFSDTQRYYRLHPWRLVAQPLLQRELGTNVIPVPSS